MIRILKLFVDFSIFDFSKQTSSVTAQKMKFSIKNFFSRCERLKPVHYFRKKILILFILFTKIVPGNILETAVACLFEVIFNMNMDSIYGLRKLCVVLIYMASIFLISSCYSGIPMISGMFLTFWLDNFLHVIVLIPLLT